LKGREGPIELPIINTNRTVGTMLSHEIAKKWGERAAAGRYDPHQAHGSAGQSFGAFLPRA
jgi:glutamate synthase (NADPH/NADH) large chain